MCPHNANLLLQCALCTAREDLKRRANCTRLTRIPASSNLVRLPRDAAPRRPLGTPVLASSPPARRPQRGVGYVGEPVGARGSHGTQRLPDEATRVLAGCVRAQVQSQGARHLVAQEAWSLTAERPQARRRVVPSDAGRHASCSAGPCAPRGTCRACG